jgi:hypothetical protein
MMKPYMSLQTKAATRVEAQQVMELGRVWLGMADDLEFTEGGHASGCNTYSPEIAGPCDCGWRPFIDAMKSYLGIVQ